MRFQRNVSKANVEQVDKAASQQHSAPAGTNAESSRDDAASRDVEPAPDVTEPAHDVQVPQRVQPEVVNEPVQQRTEEQAVDEPGEKSPKLSKHLLRNLVSVWQQCSIALLST